ncbi:MAG TPA: hypothetical protein VE975_06950, partial [Actinomycetota bacterium]|nr:hypothetical protein [Actinomycetota bacterium]
PGRPQVLVAAGVPREEVEEAARAVLKNALFDLVRWRDGEFSWEADAGIEVDFSVTLSADAALDECVDRLRRAEMFLTAMPSPDQVLALSPRPPHTSHDVKVPAEGWRALVQVDGRRSVREVIAAIGGDEMDARAVLYGLYEAGLIEVRAPVVEPAKLRAVKDEELAEAVGQAGPCCVRSRTPAAGRGQEPPRQEPPRQEPAPQSRSPQPQAQAAPPVPPSAPEAAPSAQVRAPGGGPAAKEEPALDRAQLVRELAGLLNDDAPSHPRAGSKRRVEDDRSINKGQVSRLIDGVKRLD